MNEQTPIYGTSWSWKSYRLGHDWTQEFVKVATDLAKATVDRCQPGVCGPEEWAKSVTAMAASLVLEMQYVVGDRTRPEDTQAILRAIQEASGVKK